MKTTVDQREETMDFAFKCTAFALLAIGFVLSAAMVSENFFAKKQIPYTAFSLRPASYPFKLSEGKAAFDLVIENHEGSAQNYSLEIKANEESLEKSVAHVENNEKKIIPAEISLDQNLLNGLCKFEENCQLKIESIAEITEKNRSQNVFFWVQAE